MVQTLALNEDCRHVHWTGAETFLHAPQKSLISNVKSDRLCVLLSKRLALQINDSKQFYKTLAALYSCFFRCCFFFYLPWRHPRNSPAQTFAPPFFFSLSQREFKRGLMQSVCFVLNKQIHKSSRRLVVNAQSKATCSHSFLYFRFIQLAKEFVWVI